MSKANKMCWDELTMKTTWPRGIGWGERDAAGEDRRRRIPRVVSRWWIPQGGNKQTLTEAVVSFLCHQKVFKIGKRANISHNHAVAALLGTTEVASTKTWRERDGVWGQ